MSSVRVYEPRFDANAHENGFVFSDSACRSVRKRKKEKNSKSKTKMEHAYLFRREFLKYGESKELP